jgi:acetylornithine deacetylase/succinyl-diaminopimelate desuccinylase-like protein
MKKIIINEDELLTHCEALIKKSNGDSYQILKAQYVQQLLYAYGLKDVIIDEKGNVIGKVKGKKEDEIIVINSNLDNGIVDEEPLFTFKKIVGKGVIEASVPHFVLASLARRLKLEKLEHTVYFIATTDSKKGNIGLNYFLQKYKPQIKAFINLEGLSLGEINTKCVNIKRGEVHIKGKGGHVWKDIGVGNPINAIYKIIGEINKLSTEDIIFNLSHIESISSFDMLADTGLIKYEIRGFNIDILNETEQKFIKKLKEISKDEKVEIELKNKLEFKVNEPNIDKKIGDIFYNTANFLDIPSYSTSSHLEIIPVLQSGIDSVSIGVIKGDNLGRDDEYGIINSINKSMELLYLSVLEIDRII